MAISLIAIIALGYTVKNIVQLALTNTHYSGIYWNIASIYENGLTLNENMLYFF